MVELVVVILILGVLAAVAAPRLLDASGQSTEAATARTVDIVRDMIEMYQSKNGALPPTIDPEWFHGENISNPYDPDHPTPFFVANDPAKNYPVWKTLRPGSTFWYNIANGRLCARVPPQANDAATIELFNRVNDAAITSLTQTN